MSTRQDALEIIDALTREGFQAVFAGGCVRDTVLSRTPKDWDVATDALPEDIKRLFPRYLNEGVKHGVVSVINGGKVDVATFRKEIGYSDGRRPDEVIFTKSMEEDARRRDFTINAMYMTPESKIIDFFDGLGDLERKLVRAVGKASDRFAEDHLRMMRAVRFSTQLGFALDGETYYAAVKHAQFISDISAERVRDELLLILESALVVDGIQMLSGTGLLHYILPEVFSLVGVEQDPIWHPEGDVWEHTLAVVRILADNGADPILRLAGLLHDIGKKEKTQKYVDKQGRNRISHRDHEVVGAEMAREVCKRLVLTKAQTERIVEIVRWHMRAHYAEDMGKATLIEWLRHKYIGDLIKLQHADSTSTGLQDRSLRAWYLSVVTQFASEIHAKPLLNGHDLIEAGLRPGPHFDDILAFVRKLQDAGTINSKEAALQAVLQKRW